MVATATASYVYIAPLYTVKRSIRPLVTVISIPKGSFAEPVGFNVTNLLTGAYHYRFNFTVAIGVNNTVEWVNNDTVEHTVSAFIVPRGVVPFNSGLIPSGKTFSVTFTVPGIYKYTCIWHPWLAGQITVKAV